MADVSVPNTSPSPSIPDGSALHKHISDENEAKLQLLIERRVCLEIPNSFGFTPLQTACFKKRRKMVDALLRAGCLIDAKSRFTGKTALHIAAFAGQVDIIETLINHGAHVTSLDENGHNILHEAVLGGQEVMVEHVMKMAPKLALLANHIQRTPQHLAAFVNASNAIVKIICGQNSKISSDLDLNGRSVMDLAILHSSGDWQKFRTNDKE